MGFLDSAAFIEPSGKVMKFLAYTGPHHTVQEAV
jgi:hypothetical protein